MGISISINISISISINACTIETHTIFTIPQILNFVLGCHTVARSSVVEHILGVERYILPLRSNSEGRMAASTSAA